MTMPTREYERWRAASVESTPSRPPSGLDRLWLNGTGALKRIFSSRRSILKRARLVLREQERYRRFTEEQLHENLCECRELFRLGRQSKEDEEKALALIGVACNRVMGINPYLVQYAGVLAMQRDALIEMATGEGKSLVAALAGILAGWYGRGCHVITVNDYLAERDAEGMRELYEYCGCSVTFISSDMKPQERLVAYQADVTYCSEREVVADYLRDALVLPDCKTLAQKMLSVAKGKGGGLGDKLLQRGQACAVIDEADSVLIDRAVTPLIISKEVAGMISAVSYQECYELVENLVLERDYKLDMQYKSAVLLDSGQKFVRENQLLGVQGRMLEDMVVQALQARHFYKLDHDYIIDDGKVVLVDNSTGRLMRDHSWKGGIHQAVEAKEGLEITSPKDTCARISFQRFFRMYEKTSGMTGTASEARAELWQEYGLQVIPIPPRRLCLRVYRPFKVCLSKKLKWEAVLLDALTEHNKGRPVLIGTRHVRDSEHLGEIFKCAELDCQILNAVNHYEEAQIIAKAGKSGAVTIATNMAGRGTDIKLDRSVEALGGLHVIATEIHSSGRVDRQLYGRCSRQGDKGSVSVIVSWEDELVDIFTPFISKVVRLGLGGGEIQHEGVSSSFYSWLGYKFGVVLLFPFRILLSSKIVKRAFDAVFAKLCFRLAQHRTEKFFKRQRRSSVEQDYNLSESMAFGGEDLG